METIKFQDHDFPYFLKYLFYSFPDIISQDHAINITIFLPAVPPYRTKTTEYARRKFKFKNLTQLISIIRPMSAKQ